MMFCYWNGKVDVLRELVGQIQIGVWKTLGPVRRQIFNRETVGMRYQSTRYALGTL